MTELTFGEGAVLFGLVLAGVALLFGLAKAALEDGQIFMATALVFLLLSFGYLAIERWLA